MSRQPLHQRKRFRGSNTSIETFHPPTTQYDNYNFYDRNERVIINERVDYRVDDNERGNLPEWEYTSRNIPRERDDHRIDDYYNGSSSTTSFLVRRDFHHQRDAAQHVSISSRDRFELQEDDSRTYPRERYPNQLGGFNNEPSYNTRWMTNDDSSRYSNSGHMNDETKFSSYPPSCSHFSVQRQHRERVPLIEVKGGERCEDIGGQPNLPSALLSTTTSTVNTTGYGRGKGNGHRKNNFEDNYHYDNTVDSYEGLIHYDVDNSNHQHPLTNYPSSSTTSDSPLYALSQGRSDITINMNDNNNNTLYTHSCDNRSTLTSQKNATSNAFTKTFHNNKSSSSSSSSFCSLNGYNINSEESGLPLSADIDGSFYTNNRNSSKSNNNSNNKNKMMAAALDNGSNTLTAVTVAMNEVNAGRATGGLNKSSSGVITSSTSSLDNKAADDDETADPRLQSVIHLEKSMIDYHIAMARLQLQLYYPPSSPVVYLEDSLSIITTAEEAAGEVVVNTMGGSENTSSGYYTSDDPYYHIKSNNHNNHHSYSKQSAHTDENVVTSKEILPIITKKSSSSSLKIKNISKISPSKIKIRSPAIASSGVASTGVIVGGVKAKMIEKGGEGGREGDGLNIKRKQQNIHQVNHHLNINGNSNGGRSNNLIINNSLGGNSNNRGLATSSSSSSSSIYKDEDDIDIDIYTSPSPVNTISAMTNQLPQQQGMAGHILELPPTQQSRWSSSSSSQKSNNNRTYFNTDCSSAVVEMDSSSTNNNNNTTNDGNFSAHTQSSTHYRQLPSRDLYSSGSSGGEFLRDSIGNNMSDSRLPIDNYYQQQQQQQQSTHFYSSSHRNHLLPQKYYSAAPVSQNYSPRYNTAVPELADSSLTTSSVYSNYKPSSWNHEQQQQSAYTYPPPSKHQKHSLPRYNSTSTTANSTSTTATAAVNMNTSTTNSYGNMKGYHGEYDQKKKYNGEDTRR